MQDRNRSMKEYPDHDPYQSDPYQSDDHTDSEAYYPSEEKRPLRSDSINSVIDPNSSRFWDKKLKKRNLLLVSLASFLVSISQSIILPSIDGIQESLEATETQVVMTLTMPLFILGLTNLVVSPFSDAYGRKVFHISGMILFTASSIACGFSTNIYLLISFRILQSLGSGAPSIVGAGVVADMYDITERGRALGLFLLGPLIGPVFGPLFGGLIAEADVKGIYSWQLIFFIIGGLGILLTLWSIFALKETILIKKPDECPRPWAPLAFLKYWRITFLILALSIGFGGFFALNINFSIILSEIYQFSPAMIGVCYLPFGAGLMIGTVIGGRTADRMRRKGGTAEHRLVPSLLFLPLNGAIVLLQGWVFQIAAEKFQKGEELHLSIVLIVSFFLGLTFILPRPGTNTYAIEKLKKLTGADVASSATGLIFGVMLPSAALIAQLSILGQPILGYGVVMTIIGGTLIISTIPIGVYVVKDIKQHKNGSVNPSHPKQYVNYQNNNSTTNTTYDAIN